MGADWAPGLKKKLSPNELLGWTLTQTQERLCLESAAPILQPN